MTRAELRRRVQRALNDADGTFATAALVHAWLDEALEVLAEEAPALKRTSTIPRRPGTAVYTLAGCGDRVMTPTRLWLPDLARRLEAVSLTELDRRHPAWWTCTGTPELWAPVDWRQFVVWPIPTTGGGWLEVDCLVWPDGLTDDGDTPELHESAHEALVLYGQIEGALTQWDTARALTLSQAFLKRWGQARSLEGVQQLQSRLWARERADRGDV